MSVPRELIDRCLHGEKRSWEELTRRFGALVGAAVRNTLRRARIRPDENEVEEVCQAVWVSLCEDDFRRLRSFESKCSFTTWLTVLSTRRALDHLRTERRKGTLKNLPLEEHATDLLTDLRAGADPVASDDRELVLQSMGRIPAEDRLILKLYYLDGLSYRSVGRILGVTANTVGAYLEKAKEHLRRSLTPPVSTPKRSTPGTSAASERQT